MLAAAAAGLTHDAVYAWVRRGHVIVPPGGWRREDIRHLIALSLLTAAGFAVDCASVIVSRFAGALDGGTGFLLFWSSTSLAATGSVSDGDALVVDDAGEVSAAVGALLRRQGWALGRLVVLDLAEIARRGDEGFWAALTQRRPPGRPRKEAA